MPPSGICVPAAEICGASLLVGAARFPCRGPVPHNFPDFILDVHLSNEAEFVVCVGLPFMATAETSGRHILHGLPVNPPSPSAIEDWGISSLGV